MNGPDTSQATREQATVILENGTEVNGETVELSPGWVHVEYWDSLGDRTVEDYPTERVQRVESTEVDY